MEDTYYAPVGVSDRFAVWVRRPAVWYFWDQVSIAVPLLWICSDERIVRLFVKDLLPTAWEELG